MSTPVSLPARIFTLLKGVLKNLLDSTQHVIAENFQDVLLGIFTIILGWMIASVCRGLASKMTRALGVDVIADRSGLRKFMIRSDIHQPPSKHLGVIVYAMILYATALVAFESMGLETVSDFLRRLASYIPRAGVVFILLVLGVGLGKLIKGLSTRAARMSGLPMPEFIGSFCRMAVVLFAFFLALNYLKLASESVLISGFALVISVGLALSILFTLAAKELMESLLSHPFVKNTYQKGQVIQFGDYEGEVLKIDATSTHLRSEKGINVVPNRIIASNSVTILTKKT